MIRLTPGTYGLMCVARSEVTLRTDHREMSVSPTEGMCLKKFHRKLWPTTRLEPLALEPMMRVV